MKIRQTWARVVVFHLKKTMSEFGHTQDNYVISNSSGNILDLIFTNIQEMISTVSELPCIFLTDHAALNF